MNYRDELIFEEFVDFNDVGLPLSYFIYKGIVESTPLAQEAIDETFILLLSLFGINEDTGFNKLEEISGEV
jgi:hypothetical protein